jgi:hypothetical protein
MAYKPQDVLRLMQDLHDGVEDWNAYSSCHVFQAALGDELIYRNRDDQGAGPTKQGLAILREMRRGDVDHSQIIGLLAHTARIADAYEANPL